MRLIKYSVAVLLFLLVALCNGELFQLHFMEADYPDWVEVNLQDIPVQAFYTETDKAAKESGVSVFYRDYNYNAAGQSITLYASDDNAAQYYESTYGIAPGVYKSLFMGDAVFEQASLADCTKTGDSLRFGLLGETAAKEAFLAKLETLCPVENQALGTAPPRYFDSEAVRLSAALWVVACVLGAMLGLYETVLFKKEAGVRITLGERAGSLFCKRVLLDGVVFAGLFLLAFGGLSALTYTRFAPAVTLCGLGAYWLVNLFSALPLLRLDLQKTLGNAMSPGILAATYALKTVSCVLAVTVAAAAAGVAAEQASDKREGAFFRKYQDYNLVHFYVPVRDDNFPNKADVLAYQLQAELLAENRTLSLASAWNLSSLSDGFTRTGVFCSHTAKNILTDFLNLPDNALEKDGMYILVPDYRGYENDIALLKEDAAGYAPEVSKMQVVSYKSGASLPVVADTGKTDMTKMVKDPVVGLQNYVPPRKTADELRGGFNYEQQPDGSIVENWSGGYFSGPENLRTMVCADEAYVQDFLARQGCAPGEVEYTITNVYESTQQAHLQSSRLFSLSGILLAFMLFLECIVTGTVIRLEYTVHAKELAIKTVLGYAVWDKHRRIFLTTLFLLLLGIIAGLLISSLADLGSPFWIGCAGAALAGFELLILVGFIRRAERAQIVKILKGGSL